MVKSEMHPCRCETCTNPNCPTWIGTSLNLAQSGKMNTHAIAAVTSTVGCCYHSQAREYLNRDVIEELEKRSTEAKETGEPVFECVAVAYDEALSLLRGDDKK